jgi:hypothetical protein
MNTTPELPSRGMLTKKEYQTLLGGTYGVVPGMPAYFRKAGEIYAAGSRVGR